MGLNIGKITNKVAAVQAVGDKLGLFNKKKKDKAALKQDPKTVITEKRRATAISQYQFPSDIGSKYFFMKFKEYSYAAGTSGAVYGSAVEVLKDYIVLPIPKELGEEYNVSYKDEQMGMAGAAVDFIARESQTGAANDAGAVAGAAGLAAPSATAAALGVNAIKQSVAGKALSSAASLAATLGIAGQSVQSAASLGLGIAQNPVERALLDNVPLRNHSFTFKMSPRNQSELESINKIIHQIRTRMHPANSLGELTYEFPDIVEFGFKGTLKNVPFKPSVVTSLKIDYAPDGASFFMKSGEPVAYVVSIGLKEFEPIRKTDFAAPAGGSEK
jgi:hypothetical protein